MKKILITLIVLIVLVAGCAGGCEMLNRTEYIKGSRIGYITKFSQRGLFWKCYQGEVNMGGARDGAMGSSVANLWNFSLDNQRRRGENIDSLAGVINRFLLQSVEAVPAE